MNQPQIPLEEKLHLDKTLSIVQAELDSVRAATKAQQQEMDRLRSELQTDRELANLWSSEEFEDLADLSQSVRLLTMQEETQDTAVARRIALEYQQHSPYFARLTLRFPDEEEDEPIYIGRFSLWNPKEKDLAVHDWRSPIASVFYRFGMEPAYYTAPLGRIDCLVTGKRQYEIRNGQIVYCFDADSVIQDKLLRKMLSQNASSQMRSIVETIQKDQDIAIRDEEHDLLMVQGVAGSGKTSIALHRVAYLMYEGLKNRLRSHNILILSPNTVFEKYISSVLPELGQRNTAAATLEYILENFLHTPVQSRVDRIDSLCKAESRQAEAMRRMLDFKSSPEFVAILDRFLQEIPRHFSQYQDLWYGDHLLATAQSLKNEIMQRDDKWPLGVRLHRLENILWEKIRALRPERMKTLYFRALQLSRGPEWARAYSLYETASLSRQIQAITRLSVRQLYLSLFADETRFLRLAKGIPLPSDIRSILTDTCEALRSDQPLPLSDASAMAYLKVRLEGRSASGDIRQVVIDEAQDYGMADYALLQSFYPNARFTVLGDINQSMERGMDHSFFGNVQKQLKIEKAALIELNKSFRCTKEILSFSEQFLKHAALQSFNRSGEEPKILPNDQIISCIRQCKEMGYKSIALIAKTAEMAEKWHARLSLEIPIRLMGRDINPGDVFIVPLALTKGLEFDAVFLLDCDETNYSTEDDRRLLYVACTRALHFLSFFYTSSPSLLLKQEDQCNG